MNTTQIALEIMAKGMGGIFAAAIKMCIRDRYYAEY